MGAVAVTGGHETEMSDSGAIEQRGFGESRGSPVADVFSLLLQGQVRSDDAARPQ